MSDRPIERPAREIAESMADKDARIAELTADRDRYEAALSLIIQCDQPYYKRSHLAKIARAALAAVGEK